MTLRLLLAGGSALVLMHCGENTGQPVSDFGLGPPQQLRALSVNDSTVRLSWSLPSGLEASMIRGYQVTQGGHTDSVQSPLRQHDVVVVPPGEALFTVRARLTTNQLTEGAEIRWAPASRFDDPLAVYEYDPSQQGRACGIDIGSQSQNPRSLSVLDGFAPSGMDLYLIGQGGQPLVLRSAHLYVGSWSQTVFSTTSHSSISLDYPLEVFPPTPSFSLDAVPVENNTIYYARVLGSGGVQLFARVHVRVLGGFYPNRGMEVRISLQRKPGILFACSDQIPLHRPVL